MALAPRNLATVRKIPTQERSRVTVAAIVQAAAQIFEKDGEDAVSTKAVADRAGCSIGTLYQYFDDRDAILLALVDRERHRIAKRFNAFLEMSKTSGSREDLMRALVRSYVGRRGAKRQFALMAEAADAQSAPLFIEDIAKVLAKRWDNGVPRMTSEVRRARAFVITRAVLGVLRSAAIENSPLLGTPAFEDALCALVEAYDAKP